MPATRIPPPYPTDDTSLARDCRVEIYTGGGPGGQHRNKTQNAVRLVHEPSGITVSATERRSLEANRRTAFERLRVKLQRLNEVPSPRHPTRPTRGSIQRRLASKARASRVKALRGRRPGFDD